MLKPNDSFVISNVSTPIFGDFSSHASPALFKPALLDLVKVSLRHSHNSNMRGHVSREKKEALFS